MRHPVILAAAVSACAAGTPVDTLSNGLAVILHEDHTVPLATICMAVRTGAACQTEGTCGLAHFYEHMFFKGNAALPDQTAYNARMGELGISRNGTTSDEIVRYYVTLPSERLDEGLEFMYDAIATPLFDPVEMELERTVILNEYMRNTTSPWWGYWKAREEVLHPSAPWRANTIGTPEVIMSADPGVMHEFRRIYYTPDNCALIIAGDIDPAEAMELAAVRMSGWERGGLSDYDSLPVLIDIPRDTLVRIAAPPGIRLVSIVYEGPPVHLDPGSTYAADVWGTLMEGMSGDFYRNLVVEGPFQWVSAGYYTQRFAPTVTLSGAPRPGRTDEALAALRGEIDRMCTGRTFTREEVSAASAILARRRLLSRTTAYDVAVETLAFWWVTCGGLDYYDGYPDSISAVTPGDVEEFLDRYVEGRPSATFVVDDSTGGAGS